MKIPFTKKKKRTAEPTANDKMQADLDDKLDAAHERLDLVLVKLRKVRQMAVEEPGKLRLVKAK